MHEVNNYFFNAHLVRVALVDGEPWWYASDVCRVLEIANNRDALSRLDEDEKGVALTDTPGGRQEMSTVNEAGLYALILGSRKPSAKAFKRWVTHEVLPSIRKTGGYQAAPAPAFDIPKTFAGALALAAKLEEERAALACAVQAQAEDIAILEPKAAFADRVAVAEGAHTISAAAKILGTGQNRLFAWLRMQGFLIEGTCTPYQQHVDAGLFKVVERVFTDSDGHDHVKAKTLVTGKGMIALQRRMDADVIRPLVRPQHTGISYLGAQA
jgi:anti-repressor protein